MINTKYSEGLEAFLNFLRSCEEENRVAAIAQIDLDNATQDILHNIELNENSQYDFICQGLALKEIRRRRRTAKDTEAVTSHITVWINENKQTIKDLERLLGAVRKAEKRTVARTYKNRTSVMDSLLE